MFHNVQDLLRFIYIFFVFIVKLLRENNGNKNGEKKSAHVRPARARLRACPRARPRARPRAPNTQSHKSCKINLHISYNSFNYFLLMNMILMSGISFVSLTNVKEKKSK